MNNSKRQGGSRTKTAHGAGVVLWLYYVPPSLNVILSAPLRARFGMKSQARAVWGNALRDDHIYRCDAIADPFLRLRSLLSCDGSGMTTT